MPSISNILERAVSLARSGQIAPARTEFDEALHRGKGVHTHVKQPVAAQLKAGQTGDVHASAEYIKRNAIKTEALLCIAEEKN